MWVPAGLVYIAIALMIVADWLRRIETGSEHHRRDARRAVPRRASLPGDP
jgi:hypothetical protein